SRRGRAHRTRSHSGPGCAGSRRNAHAARHRRWRNFESWEETGSIRTPERANVIYKKILEEFEPPAMDPGIREELDSFVERRRSEGGAPTDF
ncbi:MAG: trimethylamine methyltransferase family protein, partial [Pseudomonadota bacterium]